MPRLNETMKAFVVERLACMATPTDVVEEVKEIFGLELSRQQVHYYDPTAPAAKTPKKWRELYEVTQEAWLTTRSRAGVAYQNRRLEELDRLYERVKRSGNYPLALQILEQAAKEMGGVFTNRHKHEHMGKDGKPIEHRDLSHDELLARARVLARRVTELTDNATESDDGRGAQAD